jgi:hypothetical protein
MFFMRVGGSLSTDWLNFVLVEVSECGWKCINWFVEKISHCMGGSLLTGWLNIFPVVK